MKKWIIAALTVLPAAAMAQDAPTPIAVSNTPPLLLTLIVLGCSCACVAFCIQVLSLVRGGQLSRSWFLFTTGFAILALSQVVVLLNGFGVIPNIRFLFPSLLILMSGLFVYGLYDTKRVLG
jgi:hypothetical protein